MALATTVDWATARITDESATTQIVVTQFGLIQQRWKEVTIREVREVVGVDDDTSLAAVTGGTPGTGNVTYEYSRTLTNPYLKAYTVMRSKEEKVYTLI
jgi:hypothetical protein